MPPKVEARRRAAAQRAINQYTYEPSKDEVEAAIRVHANPKKRGNGRFEKLKQTVARLEQPYGDQEKDAADPATTFRGNGKRKASEISEDEEQQEPKKPRLDLPALDFSEMGAALLKFA